MFKIQDLAQALHAIRRDLGHAARSLAKDRGFTLVCVISLGTGMGGLVALATFTRMITAPARVVDTTGLTELLVLPLGPLREKAGEWALEQWSYPDYQALRDAELGMAVTGWTLESSQFGEPDPDEAGSPRVSTLYVSANYFNTFGVSLARGPGFDPATDDAPLGELRVILSHDFWQRRMAADPDIVGKSVAVDGVPHTVVGIAPDDFRGHFHFFQAPGSLLFIPLERHPRLRANPNLRDDRTVDWVRIHGRLQPGVDITREPARFREHSGTTQASECTAWRSVSITLPVAPMAWRSAAAPGPLAPVAWRSVRISSPAATIPWRSGVTLARDPSRGPSHSETPRPQRR